MQSPNVAVNVHAIASGLAASARFALVPDAPIGPALALAFPTLSAASDAGVPVALSHAAPTSAASPKLRVLRQGRLVPVDPSKTAQEQNITDGAELVLQAIPLTEDELLTRLIVLTVSQGDLSKALTDLRAVVEEKRHFRQRDHALWFILTTFAVLLLISLGMLIADGLGAGGFHMAEFVRNALVSSVLGEVAGLVAIAFRFVFRIPGSDSPKTKTG